MTKEEAQELLYDYDPDIGGVVPEDMYNAIVVAIVQSWDEGYEAGELNGSCAHPTPT